MTEPTSSPLARLSELIADASFLGTAPSNREEALHAVKIGNQLEQVVRAHLEDSVAMARARGVSWQDIGNAFGTTRQAAFRRFGTVPTAAPSEGLAGTPIIDLFSRTEEVFVRLSTGDYSYVKSLMTFTCARALTKKRLMSVWDQIVTDSGLFNSCSDTTLQTADGTSILAQQLNQYLAGGLTGQTHICHESGNWIGRVAYNGAGRITGILISHPLEKSNLPF